MAATETSDIPAPVDYSFASTQSFEVAKQAGIREAEKDFSNGVFRIQQYGMRSTYISPNERQLEEKYGIHPWPVAGCIVTQAILGRAEGYNTRMKELLFQHFGKDVFAEKDDKQ